MPLNALRLSTCTTTSQKGRDVRRAVALVDRAHARHLSNRDSATPCEWKWTWHLRYRYCGYEQNDIIISFYKVVQEHASG